MIQYATNAAGAHPRPRTHQARGLASQASAISKTLINIVPLRALIPSYTHALRYHQYGCAATNVTR